MACALDATQSQGPLVRGPRFCNRLHNLYYSPRDGSTLPSRSTPIAYEPAPRFIFSSCLRKQASICGRPPACKAFDGSIGIACAHMCGLLDTLAEERCRDGVCDVSPLQGNGVCHLWMPRSSSHLRSIDRAILPCKFYRGAPPGRRCARSLRHFIQDRARSPARLVAFPTDHQLPGNASHLVGQRYGGQLGWLAPDKLEQPGRGRSLT